MEVLLSLSYNTLDIIKETYPLLRKSCNVPILILDNGSEDGSQEWLIENMHRPDEDPPTLVYLSNVNTGYTKGCNILIEKSKIFDPDWFILCNSDIIAPDPNEYSELRETSLREGLDLSWVGDLVSPFVDNDNAWVVGCRQKKGDIVVHGGCVGSPPILPAFDIPYKVGEYEVLSQTLVPLKWRHRVGRGDEWNKIEKIDVVSFAVCGLRKEAIDTELLDERFFLYGSDYDYCLKCIRKHGKEVWYNGRVTLEHLVGESVRRADYTIQKRALNDLMLLQKEEKYYGSTD